ncbi:MotA/TolQ/ExbB proton channel family protein [Crateriforma conspicua]|uniref:Biopolymer transport protein ExbB n=1 Tax=Crateriforma conspicua TaxID=2527996 RepID=A0A5C6FRQ5_9PLAN|nr:MotA/TolQ/ExbB proton channel family protein [Crateriforma conspicua]TWU63166.1 Biopolymer transport protein ExbB [Crateriforma conspicua]
MNRGLGLFWQSLMGLAQATSDAAPDDDGAGLFEIVFSGGWIGLIIILVLFCLSVAAAYLVFDQFMTLRRAEILPPSVADSVRQSLLTGRLADADAVCRRTPSVISVVLLAGLAEREFGWSEVEKAVEDTLAQQSARLMRRIEYLSVIGNIAPMVGLLGTVTGMIFAFQQVATTRGAAGAGDLAEGIYQALVTTVGGLVVAIPSLAAYAICRNRVDSLIAEVAQQTVHALTPIKRRPGTSQRTATRKSPASPASSSSTPKTPAAAPDDRPPKRT